MASDKQLPHGFRTLRLIEKAWADSKFKASLVSDPAAALKKEGFSVPAGAKVKVLENDVDHIYYVLPAAGAELTDDSIDKGAIKAPALSKDMKDAAAASQRVRTKAQSDPAFKKQLLADPKAVLRKEGVEVPDGVSITVVENTKALMNIVLPLPPAPAELSEAQLEAVVGGAASRGKPLGIIGLDASS